MFKNVGIMIGGIFVGAVAMEIFRKAFPEALDKAYSKVHEVACGARDAFKAGYENTARPQESVEPVV